MTGPVQTTEAALSRVGRARAWGDAKLDDNRQKHATVDMSFRAYQRDKRAAGQVLSSALAFALFLIYVPLAAVIVSLAGISNQTESAAQSFTHRFGLLGIFASSAAQATQLSNSHRWTAFSLALIAFLFGLSSLIIALRVTHQLAWGMPIRLSGNVATGMLRMIAAVGVMVVAVIFAGWVRKHSVPLGIVVSLVNSLVFFVVWLWLSWGFPHRASSWRALVPGAILFAVAMDFLHVYTANFLPRSLAQSSGTYGSLGPAFTMLGILFILGRIMMASPVLNAARLEHHEERAVLAQAAESSLPGASAVATLPESGDQSSQAGEEKRT
jgi:uncharacterized BrkB/YihY/UPF0761 family membrane protein